MPESSYCCAELDQQHGWEIDTPRLGRLREYEKCLVFRFHRGWSQGHVASNIGCSRYWFGKMERGEETCATLTKYWHSRVVRLTSRLSW